MSPLTKTGKKVLAQMKKQYGKRGKEVFYRSIQAGKKGSEKWHTGKKKKKGKKSPSGMKGRIRKAAKEL